MLVEESTTLDEIQTDAGGRRLPGVGKSLNRDENDNKGKANRENKTSGRETCDEKPEMLPPGRNEARV